MTLRHASPSMRSSRCSECGRAPASPMMRCQSAMVSPSEAAIRSADLDGSEVGRARLRRLSFCQLLRGVLVLYVLLPVMIPFWVGVLGCTFAWIVRMGHLVIPSRRLPRTPRCSSTPSTKWSGAGTMWMSSSAGAGSWLADARRRSRVEHGTYQRTPSATGERQHGDPHTAVSLGSVHAASEHMSSEDRPYVVAFVGMERAMEIVTIPVRDDALVRRAGDRVELACAPLDSGHGLPIFIRARTGRSD